MLGGIGSMRQEIQCSRVREGSMRGGKDVGRSAPGTAVGTAEEEIKILEAELQEEFHAP